MNTGIEEALEKLRLYIESEEFRGYDPYDTLNSRFSFKSLGKWPPVIATQIQKRNLINIRSLLGIKKDYNPKAIGLLLYGYCLLQEKQKGRDYSKQIDFLFNYLKDNYSKGYSGYCWGYNFDWASPKKYVKAYSPNAVVTAFVTKGILKYFQLTKNQEAYRILLSVPDFILKDLPRTETSNGVNFSYTTLEKDCCYNASLLSATVLSQVYTIDPKPEYKDLAKKAMDFVISKQYPDGHWNYSLNPETGKERRQIDFHQGYIIDSILEITRNCGFTDNKYMSAIEKGAEYYRKEQFFSNGRSKWRLPKIYPVEIHNQSQGIITFRKVSYLNREYNDFATTVSQWTIDQMQDRKGYFYYRRLRLATNKIPFMRWSQAWMFVALAELATLQKEEKY